MGHTNVPVLDYNFMGKVTDTIPKTADSVKKEEKTASEIKVTAPKVTAPKVTPPKVTLPKVAGTKVEAPKLTAPKVEAPKVKAPEVKVPQANTNLFKKIAEAFKFKKHSREKEKKRVIEIFETLGINDSIAASYENVQILIDELSIRENQHFDSLLSIINTIKLLKEKPEKHDKPVEKKAEVEAVLPSASKIVTDEDIDNLTNKLLPLINEKANEEKADLEKSHALSTLRKVRYGPKEIKYIVDSAKGLVRRYTLSIKNRSEVYGIHNYTNNSNYDDYKLNYLNTLIYQSLFINGRTGDVKDFNGWDRAKIISDAQNASCKVVFTAAISQPLNVVSFLSEQKSLTKFQESAIYLLKLRKANGVNIAFTDLPATHREQFSIFIGSLSAFLKGKDSTYKLFVTIPSNDAGNAYDLKTLTKYVDRFIIDYSKLAPRSTGPLAPLLGKAEYTIQSSVSRYLNADIAPEKIVLNLPYSGTKWIIDGEAKPRLMQYLTYSEILNRYQWPVYYDEMSGNAVMDSLNNKGMPIRSIWYDDENSLEKKYDFIINNNLGGVSINALGYDKGYGELWDMLAYKFSIVDTVFLKDSIIEKREPLTSLDLMKRKLALYWYILKNPCEVCFENIKDPETYRTIGQYLTDLKIDSLRTSKNEIRSDNKKIRSKFEYVNDELTSLLGYFTLFFLVLLIFCSGIYIFQIKVHSEKWKWKKLSEITLIVLAVLGILFLFSYLFSNDAIPLFGASPSMSENDIVQNSTIDSTQNKFAEGIDSIAKLSSTNNSYCNTNPQKSCINMPLTTLMSIIFTGMLLGLIITRIFIMPLIKRNDVP